PVEVASRRPAAGIQAHHVRARGHGFSVEQRCHSAPGDVADRQRDRAFGGKGELDSRARANGTRNRSTQTQPDRCPAWRYGEGGRGPESKLSIDRVRTVRFRENNVYGGVEHVSSASEILDGQLAGTVSHLQRIAIEADQEVVRGDVEVSRRANLMVE